MTRFQTNTVFGAYALALSLALFRAAYARTVQDIMLVIAFTGAEVSVVHLLERRAKEVETAIADWQRKETLRGELTGSLKAIETEWLRRQEELRRTCEEMQSLELASEEDLLLSDPKILQTICVNAMQRGYRAGIAKNFGDLGSMPGEENK